MLDLQQLHHEATGGFVFVWIGPGVRVFATSADGESVGPTRLRITEAEHSNFSPSKQVNPWGRPCQEICNWRLHLGHVVCTTWPLPAPMGRGGGSSNARISTLTRRPFPRSSNPVSVLCSSSMFSTGIEYSMSVSQVVSPFCFQTFRKVFQPTRQALWQAASYSATRPANSAH